MTRPESKRASSRRRGSGAVTLRDVAVIAGVAPITASRALNTPDKVSSDVLSRVRDAIAQTGYLPNLLAGGLSSLRSRVVAASVPTIAGPVFLEMVHSLTESLFTAGYQVMLGQTGYDNAREDAWLEAVLGRRPDGIVLTGIVHSAQVRKRLAASGIPVVETWDLTDDPIDMLVGFSHVEVGRAVARYLVGRGRKRLAVVTGDDERARRRSAAFHDAALELGARRVSQATIATPTTIGGGRNALARLLDEGRRIDAVFCSSDQVAQGVIIEARSRGIRIPEQLAVFGFGDLSFAGDLDPALTTVHIDGRAIGAQAARFVIDRAEGRRPLATVDVGFTITERDST